MTFLLPSHRRGSGGLARLRKARPSLLPLEERSLLSGLGIEPTADEQYMLELINLARSDPAAEAQRLVALAQDDPVLRFATRGWDLNQFQQVLSSYEARPPLAFNPRLIGAARDQSEAMLIRNNQFHSPRGYLTNPSVAQAADGQAHFPTNGERAWATGENVFAYSRNVRRPNSSDYVEYYHAGFLIDWGNPNFGHLRNLMGPGPSTSQAEGRAPFSEIGIGFLMDAEPTVPPEPGSPGASYNLNVGPAIVTQEFGWRDGRAFLTGSFYQDLDGNAFYTPGEGLGGVTIRAVGQFGEGVFETQTWREGGYSLELPPGTYNVLATGNLPETFTTVVTIGQDNVGWGQRIDPNAVVPVDNLPPASSVPNPTVPVPDPPFQIALTGLADLPVPADFNGNGRADLVAFRPETAEFLVRGSASLNRITTSGQATDIPLLGDYNGDGRADLAIFRPSTAEWFIQAANGETRSIFFGAPGLDLPIPADYDGDGITDIAVYRPTTAEWLILRSRDGAFVTSFGAPGLDLPIPADYDGDGRADLAVFRPNTAEWLILQSRDGAVAKPFGAPGLDLPIPADYDGDGRADLAVFRPNTAEWLILQSRDGARVQSFGQGGETRQALASVLTPRVSDFGPIAARLAARIQAPAPASDSISAGIGGLPTTTSAQAQPRSAAQTDRLPIKRVERVLQAIERNERPALARFLKLENAPMAGRAAILSALLRIRRG